MKSGCYFFCLLLCFACGNRSGNQKANTRVITDALQREVQLPIPSSGLYVSVPLPSGW